MRRGFSLLEMMVVIGIITLLTSVVLFNKQGFNNSILLTNLAYDVALSIREAQVYGIVVKGYQGSFDSGYGVHFESEPVYPYPITGYTLFVDGSSAVNNFKPNFQFDQDEAVVRSFSLQKGYTIDICFDWFLPGPTPLQYERCRDPDFGDIIDITFVRPDPDAFFFYTNPDIGTYRDDSGSAINPNIITAIRTKVISPNGSERSVKIYRNGQIAVCKSDGTC